MGKRHDISASLSELFDDRCLVFRRRLWNGFAGTRKGAFQRLADRERVSGILLPYLNPHRDPLP